MSHYRQLLAEHSPYHNRWDSIIQYYAKRHSGKWESPEAIQEAVVPWQLIKAQVGQESGFNPTAKSSVGAKGLLQLMPSTDIEIDGELDGYIVEGNLKDGVYYLVQQYLHFPEIPLVDEKWKFALGSYNGGRGYINKALYLARQDNNEYWQLWDVASKYLNDPRCIVNGKTPDHKQITTYVRKIWRTYNTYLERA